MTLYQLYVNEYRLKGVLLLFCYNTWSVTRNITARYVPNVWKGIG